MLRWMCTGATMLTAAIMFLPASAGGRASGLNAEVTLDKQPWGVEVTVKNTGTVAIKSVVFKPTGFTIVALGAVADAGYCKLAAGTMVCDAKFSIPPGGTESFTIKTWSGSPTSGSIWINDQPGTAGQAGPFHVGGEPASGHDVGIEFTRGVTSIRLGPDGSLDVVAYDIAVHNAGPDGTTATVTFFAELLGGIFPVHASGDCSDHNWTTPVTCERMQLPAGATRNIHVVVKVHRKYGKYGKENYKNFRNAHQSLDVDANVYPATPDHPNKLPNSARFVTKTTVVER